MFTDSRDISDPKVLVELAREVGCDPDRFAADLEDRNLAAAVLAEHREAVGHYGIRAIPSVVIGGQRHSAEPGAPQGPRVVEGAVPEGEYLRLIEAVRGGRLVRADSGPADPLERDPDA